MVASIVHCCLRCQVRCTYTYVRIFRPPAPYDGNTLFQKMGTPTFRACCFRVPLFLFPTPGSTQRVLDYSTNYKMVAPKAEIPLYHQSREHSRPSFSRRKRASAGTKRRSGGNTVWWSLVIISPLVLVAFCLGTFLGIELARTRTKDSTLGQGMYADQCPRRRRGVPHKGWVVEISRPAAQETYKRAFLPFGVYDSLILLLLIIFVDQALRPLCPLASWVMSKYRSTRSVQCRSREHCWWLLQRRSCLLTGLEGLLARAIDLFAACLDTAAAFSAKHPGRCELDKLYSGIDDAKHLSCHFVPGILLISNMYQQVRKYFLERFFSRAVRRMLRNLPGI